MKAWRGRFIKEIVAQLTDEEAAEWAVSSVPGSDGILVRIDALDGETVNEFLTIGELAGPVRRTISKRLVADMRELIKEPTC